MPDTAKLLISKLLYEDEGDDVFSEDVAVEIHGESPGLLQQDLSAKATVNFKIELQRGSNGIEFRVSLPGPIEFTLALDDLSKDETAEVNKNYNVPADIVKIHREEARAVSERSYAMIHLTQLVVELENGIPISADLYWSI